MAEMNVNQSRRQMTVRHRGRFSQVGIYLGKQLRMFVYQNDWKVLPMAALIAGLVGMVIRKKLFDSMEGTIMGCFAMVMVAIWNGCFNSIQVICRERDVIKRQHRSGMHISSYIVSHMLYQLLLCLLQTGITMYVTKLVGVKYDLGKPLITPWFIVDFGISMLIITYASDMMSLWVSCLAHTTTTAMTIMPFVLIFQLVFSGGMMTLPAWTEPLTMFTVSNPGLKVLTTQADYNSSKVKTIWNTLNKMRDSEISAEITVGQILDTLEDKDNPTIAELRNYELGSVLKNILKEKELDPQVDQQIAQAAAMSEGLDALNVSALLEEYLDTETVGAITVGEIVDAAVASGDIQAMRDNAVTLKTTLSKVFDLVGEEKLKNYIEDMAGKAGYNAVYEYTAENVLNYWSSLITFVLAFAALATITLEFIDKDKR